MGLGGSRRISAHQHQQRANPGGGGETLAAMMHCHGLPALSGQVRSASWWFCIVRSSGLHGICNHEQAHRYGTHRHTGTVHTGTNHPVYPRTITVVLHQNTGEASRPHHTLPVPGWLAAAATVLLLRVVCLVISSPALLHRPPPQTTPRHPLCSDLAWSPPSHPGGARVQDPVPAY